MGLNSPNNFKGIKQLAQQGKVSKAQGFKSAAFALKVPERFTNIMGQINQAKTVKELEILGFKKISNSLYYMKTPFGTPMFESYPNGIIKRVK